MSIVTASPTVIADLPAGDEGREVATMAEPSLPSTSGGLLQTILQAARDPTIDVEKLRALMSMQFQVEDRHAEREFSEALIAMKPELPTIEKDGRITYEAKGGKAGAAIPYATIENIDEQITPILQRFGFATTYRTEMQGERLVTICIVRHRGGHKTETSGPPLPCDSSGGKNAIQGWGSAMTYGRRYSLIDALNIRIKGADDNGIRGGLRFIKPEEIVEIEELLIKTGSDRDRFLQLFGIADVANMEAGAFVGAKNMLLAKQRSRT